MPAHHKILAALLLAYAVIASSFWKEAYYAFSPDGLDYSQRRSLLAFNALPIDELKASLDRKLGPDTPVALSGRILGNDFAVQRLTEGLYPRRIDLSAPMTLELGTEGESLAAFGNERFTLKGQAQKLAPKAQERAAGESLEFSFASAIAAFASVIGIGSVLWLVFFRSRIVTAELVVPALVAIAACVVGVITSLSSWLQAARPLPILLWGGVVAFVGVFALLLKNHSRLKLAKPKAETLAFAALLLVFFFRLVLYPVTLWDGRSIWLFHAKQIFFNGHYPLSDLLHGDLRWTHPDYPVAYPGWLALHSAMSEVHYNERLASLGIFSLSTALLALLWQLARRRVGRWQGAAIAACFLLLNARLLAGGYADGQLMLACTVGLLGLSNERSEEQTIGWIALCLASLLKAEGLFLSLLIVASVFWAHKRRAFYSLLVFVPAVLHKVWVRLQGVDSVLKDSSAGHAIEEFFPKLSSLVAGTPVLFSSVGYSHARLMLWAAVPMAITAIVLVRRGQKLSSTARAALAAALLGIAFAYLSISLLPEDPRWFLQTALDRLLLHSSALLVLVPFLLRTEPNAKTR